MIQKIKCYRIFTFPLYRLCMFLLLPAGLLLLPIVLPMKDYFLVSCFGIVLFTSAEIWAEQQSCRQQEKHAQSKAEM